MYVHARSPPPLLLDDLVVGSPAGSVAWDGDLIWNGNPTEPERLVSLPIWRAGRWILVACLSLGSKHG